MASVETANVEMFHHDMEGRVRKRVTDLSSHQTCRETGVSCPSMRLCACLCCYAAKLFEPALCASVSRLPRRLVLCCRHADPIRVYTGRQGAGVRGDQGKRVLLYFFDNVSSLTCSDARSFENSDGGQTTVLASSRRPAKGTRTALFSSRSNR
jgi:hypothetical protein